MNYRLRLVIRALYFTWLFVLIGTHRITFGGAILGGLLYVAAGMNSPLYSDEEKSRVRRTFAWLRAPSSPAKARRARVLLVAVGLLLVALFGVQFTSHAFLPPRMTDRLCQLMVAYVLIGLAFDWWTLRGTGAGGSRPSTAD